jgi:hypothetical protein
MSRKYLYSRSEVEVLPRAFSGISGGILRYFCLLLQLLPAESNWQKMGALHKKRIFVLYIINGYLTDIKESQL